MNLRNRLARRLMLGCAAALLCAAPATTGLAQSLGTDLYDTQGNHVGHVVLSDHGEMVHVHADVWGMPPGFHGFHLHAMPMCNPDDGFTSAGGHLNLMGATHQHHDGDMPSLYVAGNGMGTLMFATDRLDYGLLVNGAAVIVHAMPDNFGHIPERYGGPDAMTLETGDAGPRLACGVVVPR